MTASPARRQRGAALLALLAVIMLGGAWWLLSVIQPVNRLVLEREHNAKVLRQAKQAVLGWVVQNAADSTDFNPGKLPCPEALGNFIVPPSVNEGTMQGFCAGVVTAAVGRLPWKSLGIDKPFDADGEVLWYVVGTGWKVPNSPEVPLGINSNSVGGLSVDGVPSAAVAAIIAPGSRLVTAPIASQTAQGCSAQTQVRNVFPPPDANGYLECLNVAGASLRTGVVDNGTNQAFNDQVVLITAADVLDAIEPIVAARIQRDVVPHLQNAYVNSSWGGTAAEPYFPFAVAYPSSGTFDPTTSDFKGVLATAQGLLPMTASTCNPPLTNGRCDATFIAWVPATVSVTQTSTTQPLSLFTYTCAATTAAQIECTINYDMVACLVVICSAYVDVRVEATATNVARAFRNIDATVATGLSSPSVVTAPLQSSGAATGTYTGRIQATDSFGIPGLCALGLLCHGNATVTIPIGVFQEQLVNPATSDNWYWFTANNWHQVTYFAIAAPNMPGGARNCTATSNCLDVTFDVGTSLTTKRAILALAGRSVTGTTGSDRALSDFLDTAMNVDFNSTFEQKRVSRSGIAGAFSPKGAFNDRFVAITP